MQYDFKPELYMDIPLRSAPPGTMDNGTLPTAEKSDMQLWMCWTLASTLPRTMNGLFENTMPDMDIPNQRGLPFCDGSFLRINDG